VFAIALPSLTLALAAAALPPEQGAVEFVYRGRVAKAGHADPAEAPVKNFQLYGLSTPRPDGGRDVAFVVEEEGAGGWPWPARFGTVATDASLHPIKNRIRLLHEFKGSKYVLAVPFPYFEFAGRLADGARWQAPRASELPSQNDTAPWKYEVSTRTKEGPVRWRVQVTNNFGPQESLLVDPAQPLLVEAERRFVIGRGDVHVLTMGLEKVQALTDEELQRRQHTLEGLLQLQKDLKRADDDQAPELTDAQLKLAADRLQTLERQAENTPFERLVASIVRDVNTQSRRSGDVDSLARRMIGKPAPPLRLKSLDGEPIKPADVAGKIVLLHFWSYNGEPFPQEPYGQIGFLDHLYQKRRKLGLAVYGVAIDPRLAVASQSPVVARAVRKLESFMNLSYPVVFDDGTLEKLGDPERVGGHLPLWVLIDPQGTVVAYKAGNYPVKPDEGLADLDQAILALIKKERAAKAASH
jgi:hypothetical protein